jgi:hypothetical protein
MAHFNRSRSERLRRLVVLFPLPAQLDSFAPNLDNAQQLFLFTLTCLISCDYNHFVPLPRDNSTESRVLEKLPQAMKNCETD